MGSTVARVGTVAASPFTAVSSMAGGALGDQIGGITGANRTADAAQSIAQAQLAQAERERQQATRLASPTQAELDGQHAFLDLTMRANQFQQQQVKRQAQIIGQLDPIALQAFQQASQIAQGNDSPFIKPYLDQINIERQHLDSRLKAGQGAGFGQSSAGIQAQALFGQQAALGRMQQQTGALQALQGLGTSALGGSAQAGQDFNASTAGYGALQNSYLSQLGGVQQRQVNAALGSSTADRQGADSVGEYSRGLAQQSFFNQLLSAGGKVGAAAAGGA